MLTTHTQKAPPLGATGLQTGYRLHKEGGAAGCRFGWVVVGCSGLEDVLPDDLHNIPEAAM